MHKILIVDDEPMILETVSDLIEAKFDCIPTQAVNGLDGFLIAQKNKYDIIITDHKMPFMNGAAFIIATRTKETANQDTPFIMLSGYIDESLKKSIEVANVQFVDKTELATKLFDVAREILL